jgi:hypothetical protein
MLIRACEFEVESHRLPPGDGTPLAFLPLDFNWGDPMESGHAKQHRQSQLVGFQLAP